MLHRYQVDAFHAHKQKDQRTGLFVFVWVSGTISCIKTQLSPARPVRRGVLDSCALLWLLVYPRSRTSSPYRQATGAQGSWLHWGVVDAWREDPLIRGTIIGEQGGREAQKACLFCMFVDQYVWPCASLPPYLGDRWCEGSLVALCEFVSGAPEVLVLDLPTRVNHTIVHRDFGSANIRHCAEG